MSDNAQILEMLKECGDSIAAWDSEGKRRFAALEKSVNDLYLRQGRPGAPADNDSCDERKSAIDYCRVRKQLTTPKIEGDVQADYQPSHTEIDEAMHARRGVKNLFRKRDPANLDPIVRVENLNSDVVGMKSA